MKVEFHIKGDWFAGVVTAVVILLVGWALVDIMLTFVRIIQ